MQDTGQGTGVPAGTQASGLPRWVRWFLIVVAVVVVAAVVVMVLVGGQHGPGRHGSVGSVLAQGSTLAEPGPVLSGTTRG